MQSLKDLDLTSTGHRQKTRSPDIMGALTPMVFKEGFLTTLFTECRGCPGTHAVKEELSRSVHSGCPVTHAVKGGLSRSVHRECPGTHAVKGLSRSVHCRCPGAHTFKEGLFHTTHCGCTGTHIFEEKTKQKQKNPISLFSFSGTIFDSIHA